MIQKTHGKLKKYKMANLTKEDLDLIKRAKSVASPKKDHRAVIGHVGAALISENGDLYVGVNIDMPCGIGFCSEQNAIANMITNKEFKIKTIVAVRKSGKILPPCGRCREFMYQLDKKNIETEIIISNKEKVKLSKLLPDNWD